MNKLILLCGIQKTGNTWCRFFLFNYYNILRHKATKTLTFDELKEIHLRRGFYPNNQDPKQPNDIKAFSDGFPLIYHTHLGYDGTGFIKTFPFVHKWFDKFDGLLYIIRNPFDTMVSYHKFLYTRDEVPYMNIQDDIDMKKMRSLHEFTKYYLEKWISHRQSTLPKANAILDYDKLRKDPSGFRQAIELISGKVNKDAFWKAVRMSSFDNIRTMSDEVKQPYGVGGPLYKGYFCRDGRTGQYKEVMKPKTIEYIKNRCKEEGIILEKY